ncbi:GTPase IMAP family member 8-like [Saccoglossus kowalevskii]
MGNKPSVVGNCDKLVFVLIGRTGCGKSATGNSIVGGKTFDAERRLVSKTKTTRYGKRTFDGKDLVVIDTPGVFDTDGKQAEKTIITEITKCVGVAMSQGEGLDAFILVLNADDRFTKEHADSVKIFRKTFGDDMMKYLIVLFTRKDALTHDNITLDNFLEEMPKDLSDLLAKCNKRVIAFDNRTEIEQEKNEQIRELVQKAEKMKKDNGNAPFKNQYTDAIKRKIAEDQENYDGENIADKQSDALVNGTSSIWTSLYEITLNVVTLGFYSWATKSSSSEDVPVTDKTLGNKPSIDGKCEKLVFVLIGRTGCGKSATGNSIVGEKAFHSERCLVSTTKTTRYGKRTFDGKDLVVIDTPGVFDTRGEQAEKTIITEISKCVGVAMSQGEGLDAFILVLNADDRFTKEHADSIKIFHKTFGDEMMKYLIVLFTRKDALTHDNMTLDKFLEEMPKDLSDLVTTCNNRVIAFDNRTKIEQEKNEQIRELVQKVEKMKKDNGNAPFKNQYTDAIKRKIAEDQENYDGENIADKQSDALVNGTSSIWTSLYEITLNVVTLGFYSWATKSSSSEDVPVNDKTD